MEVSRARSGPSAGRLAGLIVPAAALFVLLFRFQRFGRLDFFAAFALTVALATGLSFALDRDYASRIADDLRAGLFRSLAIGVASAVVLYAAFALGRVFVPVFLPFAAADIERIYGLKTGVPGSRIALLIGLVIGPGEELFWRGFVQEQLAGKIGRTGAFLLTAALYAGVHVASGNLILVLAAAVCGLFWGALYMRFRSPALNIVSHSLWDLLIFLVRPV